jgi:hypothetical protein
MLEVVLDNKKPPSRKPGGLKCQGASTNSLYSSLRGDQDNSIGI